jgi:RNA polymerase sigma-70 factor (ECF subfamily)
MSTKEDFRAVYDAHFDFVWRSLRRLGVREADALDVTQRVFLLAHAKLSEFAGRSLLSTWLFGICRNLANDYRRSAPIRREVFTAIEEMDQLLSRYAARPESHQSDRAELAEALLDGLPAAQREVFVLFELEELSGDEIAQLLELPVGTVRSRLRLAREALSDQVRRLEVRDPAGIEEAV